MGLVLVMFSLQIFFSPLRHFIYKKVLHPQKKNLRVFLPSGATSCLASSQSVALAEVVSALEPN